MDDTDRLKLDKRIHNQRAVINYLFKTCWDRGVARDHYRKPKWFQKTLQLSGEVKRLNLRIAELERDVNSMGNPDLPSGIRVMDLQRRMSQLFELICDAFESDPSSTQGIDLEVVNESIAVRKELNEIREALGFQKNDD